MARIPFLVAGSAIATVALWSCMSATSAKAPDAAPVAAVEQAPLPMPQDTEPAASTPVTAKARAPFSVSIPGGKNGFPSEIRCDDLRLCLQGSGMCEWGILGIDLYRCAFYVERPLAKATDALLADQSMAIHLDFVRALTKDQLCSAWRGSAEVNQKGEARDHSIALQQLCDAMRDVDDGDRFTFCLAPGEGMRVRHNEQECAHIEDDAFRAFFVKLYLGPNPPTKALKKAMLGGAK